MLTELEALLAPNRHLAVLDCSQEPWQVVYKASKAAPGKPAPAPAEWDFSPQSARACLLNRVLQIGKPIVVSDSRMSPLLRRWTGLDLPFRSALCTPLAELGPRRLAFIEDRRAPQAFSPDLVYATPARSERRGIPRRIRLIAAGAVISLAVGVCLPFGGAQSARSPSPAAVLKRATASPESMALSYLSALQRGNFAEAYQRLSLPTRSMCSLETFQSAASRWLAQRDRGWSLQFRHIELVSSGRSICTVKVVPTGLAERQDIWEWRLCKEETGWALQLPQGMGN